MLLGLALDRLHCNVSFHPKCCEANQSKVESTNQPSHSYRLTFAVSSQIISDYLRFRLDFGAAVNFAARESGATPLQSASWNGYAEIVRLLLQRGAEKDQVGAHSRNMSEHVGAVLS